MCDLGVLSWVKPSGKQDLVKAALIPITIPQHPLCSSHQPHHILGFSSKASNHSSRGDDEVEKWILGQSGTCGLVSKESCDLFFCCCLKIETHQADGEGRLFVTTFYNSLWGKKCICSAV